MFRTTVFFLLFFLLLHIFINASPYCPFLSSSRQQNHVCAGPCRCSWNAATFLINVQYAAKSDRNWSGSSDGYPENFLNGIPPVSITGSPRGMNGRVPQAWSGFAVDKFKLSLKIDKF